jgi:hypothetical protein
MHWIPACAGMTNLDAGHDILVRDICEIFVKSEQSLHELT